MLVSVLLQQEDGSQKRAVTIDWEDNDSLIYAVDKYLISNKLDGIWIYDCIAPNFYHGVQYHLESDPFASNLIRIRMGGTSKAGGSYIGMAYIDYVSAHEAAKKYIRDMHHDILLCGHELAIKNGDRVCTCGNIMWIYEEDKEMALIGLRK